MKRLVIAAALALAACATTEPVKVAPKSSAEDLRILAVITSYMPGTYRSIAQDKGPGAGTVMRIARVWPEREKAGEFWFYLEQAKEGEDAKPFTQRLWRFTGANHRFVVDPFGLPGDAKQFVGEWRKPKPFEGLSPANLREYPNCSMEIGQMTAMFWAHTVGEKCRTDDPKVAYERTDMFASTAGMKQGSFGFDAAGRQVTGEAAVWDFRRLAELR